jgi:hypothetical protein
MIPKEQALGVYQRDVSVAFPFTIEIVLGIISNMLE